MKVNREKDIYPMWQPPTNFIISRWEGDVVVIRKENHSISQKQQL